MAEHPSHRNVVVLYFHRLSKVGGAQRSVCMLANALADRDHEVHLLSWDEPLAESFFPLTADVKWHRLGFRPGVSDKLRRTKATVKLLREYGARALVGFVMSGDKTIYAAAKLTGTKLVVAERNAPAFYKMRYGRLERWLSFASLHLADRIAVQFPEYIGGYPATLHDRIEVIPNTAPVVSRRARPDEPAPGGRFTLLAVGRLDREQKRLHKLIDAFAIIAHRHPLWDLLIIGDGPEEAELRRLAVMLGISRRMRLEKSTPNIFDAYAAAHLLAIPSRWEGFPNTLLEALAHNLPAVAFREAPGVAKLIEDGEAGWLACGLDDEAKLAEALDEAMANGAERARRGANGAKSMSRYAPNVLFDRWAELIRTTIETA